jgi:hypothetical protein
MSDEEKPKKHRKLLPAVEPWAKNAEPGVKRAIRTRDRLATGCAPHACRYGHIVGSRLPEGAAPPLIEYQHEEKHDMSTDYRPRKRITEADLFDGRLEKYGIHEHFAKPKTVAEFCADIGAKPRPGTENNIIDQLKTKEITVHRPDGSSSVHVATFRVLTDGSNYVHVDSTDGIVSTVTRYGVNDDHKIIAVIEQEFEPELMDEETYEERVRAEMAAGLWEKVKIEWK